MRLRTCQNCDVALSRDVHRITRAATSTDERESRAVGYRMANARRLGLPIVVLLLGLPLAAGIAIIHNALSRIW
jgi:hypothetical protein